MTWSLTQIESELEYQIQVKWSLHITCTRILHCLWLHCQWEPHWTLLKQGAGCWGLLFLWVPDYDGECPFWNLLTANQHIHQGATVVAIIMANWHVMDLVCYVKNQIVTSHSIRSGPMSWWVWKAFGLFRKIVKNIIKKFCCRYVLLCAHNQASKCSILWSSSSYKKWSLSLTSTYVQIILKGRCFHAAVVIF